MVAEFSTVSAAGVPIDTPTYYFPSDDMQTLDLATGLPNPAQAERARRNPKVGLLIEGRPEEPVVVVRARAAVRDSDIQSNAIRYLAETGYRGISHGITWEKARLAVTYWSRIIIENKPERIYWWDNQAALDSSPQIWNAAPDTVYPVSDPPPSGKMKPSAWPVRPWQSSPKMPSKAARRVTSRCLTMTDIPCRCGHALQPGGRWLPAGDAEGYSLETGG